MTIDQRPEWKELLKEKDPGNQFSLTDRLVRQLDADEIAEIASVFYQSPEADARYRAAGVLLSLYRNKNVPLSPDLHKNIQNAADENIRKEYPKTLLSLRCFNILRFENGERAEQFLLSEVDPTRLSSQELGQYFHSLEFIGSYETIRKLRQLETLPGEIARRATESLGNIGKLSRAQLESLVSQFKSERTASLLYKIFYVYLRFQIGKPIQAVRDLLGEPDHVNESSDIRRLFYKAVGARGEVQILYDKNGVITDTVADD